MSSAAEPAAAHAAAAQAAADAAAATAVAEATVAAQPGVAAAVKAFAEADFTEIADRFSNAGYQVHLPARGILQINSATPRARTISVALSVGVHGDETGPIELLAHLLDALAQGPRALAVDLLVVVGNVAAIASGKRFIEVDLNRLFRSERGALAKAVEAERADTIMRATSAFFSLPAHEKWHLDLHTAIRPSHYPTFAIVPDCIGDAARQNIKTLLGDGGIGALVMNPSPSGTYSYYSGEHFGAAAATVELGRVASLGQNDMTLFADIGAAIDALLRGDPKLIRQAGRLPHIYKVAQEIIKHSDGFTMAFDQKTENFTALPEGALIATDGETVYRVRHGEELVVFPNPNVRIGFRAGLMVVREE